MSRSSILESNSTFNGWANYETWAVSMYLDGNYDGEGTYQECLYLVREALEEHDEDDTCTQAVSQSLVFSVEDRLKDWTEEMIVGEPSGIVGDLLGHALGSVDWRTLAEHKIQEVRES